MPKAQFTYEVRSIDQEPVGIEDYVVRTTDGEPVGTVGALLERDGERLLVVESGVPPVKPVERALPWSAVERVDHEALAVWLALDRFSLEREALELDSGLAIEEGSGEPEARRVDRPPADVIPPARSVVAGPVDRTIWAPMLGVFAAFAFSVLAVAVVVTFTGDNTWALLLLVPAALAVVLGLLAFRFYRAPYDRSAARKP